MITHGMSRTPLYRVWIDMKSRVYNKNNKRYNNYGGRGISICKEWNQSAKKFMEWALDNGYKKGLVIDREDNDDGYYPYNCRFVTPMESSHNTRLLYSNNTSGYRGVSYYNRDRKWRSCARINSKLKHLGFFDSPILAALRYDAEAYMLNDGRPMNFMINHKR